MAVMGASAYVVVSFISGQLQVAAKQRELDAVTTQVEQQAERNREMLMMIGADNEDSYVERVAQEKLGYAHPNERVFVDISGD